MLKPPSPDLHGWSPRCFVQSGGGGLRLWRAPRDLCHLGGAALRMGRSQLAGATPGTASTDRR